MSLLSALNDFQEHQLESEDNNQGQDNTFRVNNLTKDDNTTTDLLNLIKQLTEKVDKLSHNQTTPSCTINPKTGKPYKRYCWSCRCCDHWGKNCPNKKTGHQDTATFKDRKGGSNKDCLPNRE